MAKHSHADRVVVALKLVGNELELVVQDNGRGFDPQEVAPTVGTERGYGLGSMRERAELSGGTASVDCVEGSGTTVRACWALGAVTS